MLRNRSGLLLATFLCCVGTWAVPGPRPRRHHRRCCRGPAQAPSTASRLSGAGTAFPRSVACPSATLCVAVDAVSNVLTSTDPTGGASTWQRSLVDPGTWFASISCPSATLCVTGDGDGNLVVSSDPTGGVDAWSKDSVTPGAVIDAITCSTTSFCAARNQAGQVITSSDPTRGAASWSAKSIVALK